MNYTTEKTTKTIILDCNENNDLKTFQTDFKVSLSGINGTIKELCVKQISFSSRTNESINDVKQTTDDSLITYPVYNSYVYTVSTDLINNQILGSFVNGCSVSPNSYFYLGKTIDGEYSFSIRNANTANKTLCNGLLVLTLEFSK